MRPTIPVSNLRESIDHLPILKGASIIKPYRKLHILMLTSSHVGSVIKEGWSHVFSHVMVIWLTGKHE